MITVFIIFLFVGLIFVGISIPLLKRKVPINNWYGVRLPNIMKDENVWYETNYKSAKLLLKFGIAISFMSIIVGLIPQIDSQFYTLILTIFVLVGTVFIAIKSSMIGNKIYKANKEKYEK